jgi:hypothetical protein
MMEEACSSEMSENFHRTAMHNITKDSYFSIITVLRVSYVTKLSTSKGSVVQRGQETLFIDDTGNANIDMVS